MCRIASAGGGGGKRKLSVHSHIAMSWLLLALEGFLCFIALLTQCSYTVFGFVSYHYFRYAIKSLQIVFESVLHNLQHYMLWLLKAYIQNYAVILIWNMNENVYFTQRFSDIFVLINVYECVYSLFESKAHRNRNYCSDKIFAKFLFVFLK